MTNITETLKLIKQLEALEQYSQGGLNVALITPEAEYLIELTNMEDANQLYIIADDQTTAKGPDAINPATLKGIFKDVCCVTFDFTEAEISHSCIVQKKAQSNKKVILVISQTSQENKWKEFTAVNAPDAKTSQIVTI